MSGSGTALLVSLLLSALCWGPLRAQIYAETDCFSPELNRTLSEGEQALLPDCGGLVTCTEYYGLQHDRCPDYRRNACKRQEPSPAGADAPFPLCCPRLTCEHCYSARHGRHFGPGETWTESHCVRHTCRVSPGYSVLLREVCLRPGPPPPYEGCQLVGQDVSRGEHPHCCAHYRCPGHCLLNHERWISTERSGTTTNTCSARQALAHDLGQR